jgi:hypothetical protein
MTRSAKGTIDAPGKNVHQKAGGEPGQSSPTAGGNSSKGWSTRRPDGSWKINPRYTSQTCNACGHHAAQSRDNQALLRCVACEHTVNAEVNAARNIALGQRVTARGGLPFGRAGEP